jgi:hypothetical protein
LELGPLYPAADFDAAKPHDILNVAKLQREADVEQHHKADELGGRFEVAEGEAP